MEERKSIAAGAVAFALLLTVCVALIHPFVNTGISDDFSFIRSAKDFADTGRMVYNGWSSPILGWMLPLGALFIKLFGFSFTAVRVASFSIAVLNGLLLQWILLRVGCSRAMALFGATAVVLSPASLPAAVLFFTDQPGLLALLVTLTLCIRIVRAETPRATQYWIAAAFLASFLLGTARQLLWVATLVMVPSAVWLVRKRKGVLAWAAACFVLTAVGIAGVISWWNRQPYALREPLINHYPLGAWARYLILPELQLAVLLAPVLSLFLRRKVSKTVYGISGALALVVLLVMSFNSYDLLYGGSEIIFADAPRWIFLLAAAYSCALLPIVGRIAYEEMRRVHAERRGELSFRELSALLLPFSCALFVAVSTRESFFARYLLPVMAALMIWLTKLWADLGKERQRVGIVGPVWVAIYCALSVMVMHDLFRVTDATLSLTQWYSAQGMPRDKLEAGFPFDGWYQIQRTGFINEPRTKVPVGAYVNHDLPKEIARCHNFFLPDTPSIHSVYGVGEAMSPCFDEPILHEVQYTAWMAPHHRTVFLARFAPKYALPAQ